MIKILLILSCSIIISIEASAQFILSALDLLDSQKVKNAQVVQGNIEGTDTVLYVFIREVTVFPPRKFKSEKERIQYTRLMHNVKKVYPYAKLIHDTYAQIEQDVAKMPDRSTQKKYIKVKEKELREKFEGELTNLTITQGKILIKLVDRETGNTTYEVVKELKGSINAFFWQSIAIMFGSNLKSEYKPTEEDKMIEEIIILLENGQL